MKLIRVQDWALFVQSRTPAALKDSTLSLRVSSNGLNFQPSASSFLELNKGSSLTRTNLQFGLDQDAASIQVSGTDNLIYQYKHT
jgi:hypothetical protein